METSASNLWEKEYRKGGIPSSSRLEPSGSVVKFTTECLAGRPWRFALDIGCGSGRNSLFLAAQGFAVTAMDYAASQIEALKAATASQHLSDRITAVVHDIRTPWPVADGSVDVAIDAFCFKHQIAQKDIAHYVGELLRVGSRNLRLMLSFAARDDGYYSMFPVDGSDGPGQTIIDPENSIASRLYDLDDIKAIFSPALILIHSEIKRMQNVMHGKTYDRATYVTWWSKANQ